MTATLLTSVTCLERTPDSKHSPAHRAYYSAAKMSSAMPSVPGRTGSWVVMVTIASVIEHTRSSSAVIFAKRGFVGDGHQGDPLTCDDP